jgi:LDH2 family malate/lactate/ureidoglycolate dehydrogenase
MPGEQAERNIAAAREHGVTLADSIARQLAELAARLGVAMPAALQGA